LIFILQAICIYTENKDFQKILELLR